MSSSYFKSTERRSIRIRSIGSSAGNQSSLHVYCTIVSEINKQPVRLTETMTQTTTSSLTFPRPPLLPTPLLPPPSPYCTLDDLYNFIDTERVPHTWNILLLQCTTIISSFSRFTFACIQEKTWAALGHPFSLSASNGQWSVRLKADRVVRNSHGSVK